MLINTSHQEMLFSVMHIGITITVLTCIIMIFWAVFLMSRVFLSAIVNRMDIIIIDEENTQILHVIAFMAGTVIRELAIIEIQLM